MEDLKYLDILKLNQEQKFDKSLPLMTVSVLSNTTITQVKDVLELKCKKLTGNIKLNIGDYDNIVQDSERYSQSNLVIIFWDIINIIEDFQFQIELMSINEIDALIDKTKNEISLVLKNLSKASKVLFNKFSVGAFNWMSVETGRLDYVCAELNEFLQNSQKINLSLVDLNKVFLKNGVESCIDYRYYSSSKSLYTIGFYKSYVKLIEPYLRVMLGRVKKVLILDCDNTLWGGVIGEDGIQGIQINNTSPKGNIFREVQVLIKKMAREGVLVNLNSKNNFEDVQEVLDKKGFITISNEDLIVKKVNWNNKVQNINEIITELNVGKDSAVFVDDSDFEVNLVRENIKEIDVLQVPKNFYDYPFKIREIAQMFYSGEKSKEDVKRVEMYKAEQKRKDSTEKFKNLNDYIESLEIVMNVVVDDRDNVDRLSQMTQKTNQFNLTTNRYSVSDVITFIESENYKVLSLDVRDKYGNYGITGMSILKVDGEVFEIETFLLSCRILGRGIEKMFYNYIIDYCSGLGCTIIRSSYVKTIKNSQVADFFELNGMNVIDRNDKETLFELKLSN